MSEVIVKQVTGVCASITERNGWTEFEIDGGGQYPTKLSTKLQPLIELGRAAGSNLAVWTYKESQGNENPNRPGTYYMNRYLDKVEVGGAAEPVAAQPSAAGMDRRPEPTHSPLIAGDKDRAITRMSCLKSAVELYSLETGTLDDVANDMLILKVMDTAGRFERWVYRDIDETPF